MLRSVRDMMLYHTRNTSTPEEQVAESRDLLDFLVTWIPTKHSAFAGLFKNWLSFVQKHLIDRDDAYLLHDELSAVNDPIYFHQFAERVAGHGLRYLADAQFQSMLVSNLPEEVANTLRQQAKSTVEVEQYIDFLHNRAFRQSLLCHQEVALTARVDPERLTNFYAASSALSESSEPDIQSDQVEKFKAPDGATLSTDHPGYQSSHASSDRGLASACRI